MYHKEPHTDLKITSLNYPEKLIWCQDTRKLLSTNTLPCICMKIVLFIIKEAFFLRKEASLQLFYYIFRIFSFKNHILYLINISNKKCKHVLFIQKVNSSLSIDVLYSFWFLGINKVFYNMNIVSNNYITCIRCYFKT